MATYVISDIHGQYGMFCELLKKIELKESDTLYVLGDMVDRGPHPIKVVQKLMEMPNAICIAGNHEYMAISCLKFLVKEITDTSLGELDQEMLDNLISWQQNGSNSTMEEFRKLGEEEKQDVIEFLEDCLAYAAVQAGGKQFLLVHAGLKNYEPERPISDYSLHELIWFQADFDTRYFADTFVVTGHTPTQLIKDNPKPGFVYRKNNHIAIDCGAHIPGGRLAAVCLDTGEEYYSSPNS